jgi:hypothetical protein
MSGREWHDKTKNTASRRGFFGFDGGAAFPPPVSGSPKNQQTASWGFRQQFFAFAGLPELFALDEQPYLQGKHFHQPQVSRGHPVFLRTPSGRKYPEAPLPLLHRHMNIPAQRNRRPAPLLHAGKLPVIGFQGTPG